MEEIPPGTRIANRYDVVRLLGRGSVKSVYLARDVLARTEVAIALLQYRPGSDPTLAPRFSREARAASVLSSPYVVRVLDVGKMVDGERYLVTEAVLGRGLDDAVAYGPANPRCAAIWTAEVLAALTEAHAHGVLHRDVKPENVLLAPLASHPVGEMARLTDFGLAKVLDANLEGSVVLMTAQGAVMGTADYMSPEQWQGGPVDPRSDLYSVGAMFYELLTGTPPFSGDSLQELCARHLTADVKPFGPEVPEEARIFEAITRRALAKRPGSRFQGADDMRAAIEQAGGFRLATPTVAEPSDDDSRFIRAELMTDVGVGPTQIVSSARVVLGRTGHVVLRCVPFTADNDRRSRTLSRRHARIEWRGGSAVLRDLRSSSGTSVSGRPIDPASPGAPLAQGDVIALGPHVRLRYEHASAEPGMLPRWARLTRVDPHGAGLMHLLLLTEAEVSEAASASLVLPSPTGRGEKLLLRVGADDLVATNSIGSEVVVVDGTVTHVGAVTITFAMEVPRPLE